MSLASFKTPDKVGKTENSLSSQFMMIKSNRRVSTKKFSKTKKNQFDFSKEKTSRQDSESWRRMKNRLER